MRVINRSNLHLLISTVLLISYKVVVFFECFAKMRVQPVRFCICKP